MTPPREAVRRAAPRVRVGEPRLRIPRPLRAYVLSDRTGYHEGCRLVFALTARDARRLGLDDVAYIDTAARRDRRFDRFSPGPVGLATLLAHGWWFECGGCFRVLREDTAGVVTDDDAFCSPECQARAEGRHAGFVFRAAEREAAAREAVAS